MSISIDSGLLGDSNWELWRVNRNVTKCRGKKKKKKKTVPAYNALPMFVDRVWFVKEKNVILFQISKQYYINEIK